MYNNFAALIYYKYVRRIICPEEPFIKIILNVFTVK